MKRFRLNEGTVIEMEGKPFELRGPYSVDSVPTYQLIDRGDPDAAAGPPVLHMRTLSSLEESYERRQLRLLPTLDAVREPGEEHLLLELPATERANVLFWKHLIRQVDTASDRRTTAAAGQPSQLALLLAKLGSQLGEKYFGKPKAVPISTYYRQRAKYLSQGSFSSLQSRHHRKGNRQQLRPETRTLIEEVIAGEIARAKRAYKKGEVRKFTIFTVTSEVLRRLSSKFKCSEEDVRVRGEFPSQTTFYNILNSFPAYDIALLRYGRAHADHKFRAVYGGSSPSYPLEEAQYDETQLDLYCVDDAYGYPLGRPWLSWFIDGDTSAPLGFHLGFEPASDAVFAATIRHCLTPKNYIKDRWPHLRDYNIYGVPARLTFDNSMSAHSTTIEQICDELDIDWTYAPRRHPWLKAQVEASFKQLNSHLLSQTPGYVLKKEIHSSDYDAAKNACISFSTLYYLIHAWMANYFIDRNHWMGGASPRQKWTEGCKAVPPQVFWSLDQLDRICSVRRRCIVDHRGVFYKRITYNSLELHRERYRLGEKFASTIAICPDDVSVAYVHLPEKRWIKVTSDNKALAGLSLHQYMLMRVEANKAKETFFDVAVRRKKLGDEILAAIRSGGEGGDHLRDLRKILGISSRLDTISNPPLAPDDEFISEPIEQIERKPIKQSSRSMEIRDIGSFD